MVNGVRIKKPKIKKFNGQWVFRLTLPDGTRRRVYSDSYQDALAKRGDVMSQKLSRKDETFSYKLTISQAIEYYFNEKDKKNLAERSIDRYHQMLNNFVTFLRHKRPKYKHIDEFDKRDVGDFVRYEKLRGLAASTINDEVDIVSELFTILIEDEYLDKNPIIKRKHRIQSEGRLPLTFSEKELFSILELAKTHNPKIKWYEFYLTAGITGLRRNELRFLTCGDVRLDDTPPHLLIKKTKTNTPKVVPLHPELQSIFKELIKGKESSKGVFLNSKGNVIGKDEPTKRLKKICNKLDLDPKKAHLHSLRRTFASISRIKGLEPEVIQKVGGWKDRSVMEKHYIDLPSQWMVEKYFNINYLHKNDKKV